MVVWKVCTEYLLNGWVKTLFWGRQGSLVLPRIISFPISDFNGSKSFSSVWIPAISCSFLHITSHPLNTVFIWLPKHHCLWFLPFFLLKMPVYCILYGYKYVPGCIYVHQVCAWTCRSQKKALDPLWTGVTGTMWVLGTQVLCKSGKCHLLLSHLLGTLSPLPSLSSWLDPPLPDSKNLGSSQLQPMFSFTSRSSWCHATHSFNY